MPQVKCKLCKKEFYAKPFFLRNGGGKYCSSACQYKGARKGRNVPCFICKKVSYKPLAKLKTSKSKKYFCSKSCQTKWRNSEFIGEKHANWVHGKTAYKSVLARNKVPQTCKLCKTRDKRILAVHHKDQNRLNNKLNNLVWVCHNCHHLIHHYNVVV
ncbi:hypothetical protein CL654_02975 [bacterium]|nr:hypothetical protein [bacterium]